MLNQTLSPPLEALIQQEISLYQELLECLEQEVQALNLAQEETILGLAAYKEEILGRLLETKNAREGHPQPASHHEAMQEMVRLQRQVAVCNLRNREIISASLEVIQEFISQFHPPGPGLYLPEGHVDPGSGRTLFHRQV